ncbi:cuticle protein 12.5-like [Rhipicephalus sanguineus]|uniref:cuticle protein 12.5-like n=1 Tax=Rhipicephalus sanguineus TaxID=34632 RepID=UPI0018956AAE|nr:cuticle protein 12.5-like [Rhipicephalus sanguineus]
MTGLRACILLALACAAYGGYVVPTYGGLGYHYGGYAPYSVYGTYAPTYGVYRAPVYRAPVYHTVPAPVKYVVQTPTVEAKVTDTYETQPAVPVSVSKTYTTTPVHTTVAVPAATKVVTYPTYNPTYYGYGVSPYGLSYGYGVGGYHYVPVLKK